MPASKDPTGAIRQQGASTAGGVTAHGGGLDARWNLVEVLRGFAVLIFLATTAIVVRTALAGAGTPGTLWWAAALLILGSALGLILLGLARILELLKARFRM